MYVTFSIPAVHLTEIKRNETNSGMVVTATAQESGALPVSGKLSFIDNAVDASTDTIKLKATFDNPLGQLWPGQFARVSLRVATLPNATVVASEAVQTGQDGQFVFVVKSDSTVEQRTIKTGDTVGPDTVITAGLQPGETVVTEGQLRLEPGTRIQRADPTTGEASATPGRAGRSGGRGGRGGRGADAGGGAATTGPGGDQPQGRQGQGDAGHGADGGGRRGQRGQDAGPAGAPARGQ